MKLGLILGECSAFLVCLATPCCAQTDLKEIERKAITYRSENIQRGFVRLRVVNDIDPDPTQTAEFSYELVFEGDDRIKQTRRIRLLGKDKWGAPTINVVNKDTAIYDFTPDTPVHVATSKEYGNLREHFKVLNPRPLGMDLSGTDLLHVAQLESLLNRADRGTPSVQGDMIAGTQAFRIEFKWGIGTVKIWIAPHYGYGITKAEFRKSGAGKPFVRSIQTEFKQYPIGQVWYPQKLTRVDEEDGMVVSRQIVIVEEARFGEPIPESAFQLSSLRLEPGRDVVDSTSGLPKAGVWNGTEVAPPSPVKKDSSPVEEMPPNRKWRFLIPAIVLSLAAVVFVFRTFRTKKTSVGPN